MATQHGENKLFSGGASPANNDKDDSSSERSMLSNTAVHIQKPDFTKMIATFGPWDLEAECINLDTKYVKGYIAEAYEKLQRHTELKKTQPDCSLFAPGDLEDLRLDHVLRAWNQYKGEALLDTAAIQDWCLEATDELCEALAELEGVPKPDLTAPSYGFERRPFVPLNCDAPLNIAFELLNDLPFQYWKVEDKILWYPFEPVEEAATDVPRSHDPLDFLGIKGRK